MDINIDAMFLVDGRSVPSTTGPLGTVEIPANVTGEPAVDTSHLPGGAQSVLFAYQGEIRRHTRNKTTKSAATVE